VTGDETEEEPENFWEDDDFNIVQLREANEEVGGIDSKPAARRVVKCWLEDWEKTAITKNNPENEKKILEKYKDLIWKDVDNNRMCRSLSTKLHWQKVNRSKGFSTAGYCVIGMNDDYDEDDEDTYDYWAIDQECAIHDCLYQWYKDNPDEDIVVLTNRDESVYDVMRNKNMDSDTSDSDLDETTNTSSKKKKSSSNKK
jgi:hypothetical protein